MEGCRVGLIRGVGDSLSLLLTCQGVTTGFSPSRCVVQDLQLLDFLYRGGHLCDQCYRTAESLIVQLANEQEDRDEDRPGDGAEGLRTV